jgi:rSAM/selenodomain-associated transferase 1
MNTEPCPRVGVAILAKAPIAGFAKTRLIPHLGAEGAAALQGCLLQRAVATAVAADIGPITLWCAPDINHPEFALCQASGGVQLRRQPEGDLGQRMHAAIADASPSPATLVIGTDCPALTPGLLQQAAESLQQHDATLIPAEDGGYVLIGMRQAELQVFRQVDWSTAQVMAQTRLRLAELKWRWHEFAPLWDVDRYEDYERLIACFPDALANPLFAKERGDA